MKIDTRGGTRTHLERCVKPPLRPAGLPGVRRHGMMEVAGIEPVRAELARPSRSPDNFTPSDCIDRAPRENRTPLSAIPGPCSSTGPWERSRPRTESNRVGPAYGAGASPAMLRGRRERVTGVEPAESAMATQCLTSRRHPQRDRSSTVESNHAPPASQTGMQPLHLCSSDKRVSCQGLEPCPPG